MRTSFCKVMLPLIASGLCASSAYADRHRDRHGWDHHHANHHQTVVGIGVRFGSPFYYDPWYDDWPYYYDPYSYVPPPEPRVYTAHRYSSLTMDVQLALTRRGYYRGAIDGDIGPASRAAIRAYQRDHDLPVTGRIDPPLLRSLRV